MNERIKALRKKLGLTQQAFADRLKIAREISGPMKWERICLVMLLFL